MTKKSVRKINNRPTPEATLEALQSGEERSVPPVEIYYGLSGISTEEMQVFEPVWQSLSDSYRYRLVSSMAEMSETDFELDYRTLGLHALNDPDADVRAAAIDLLWEDETLEVMNALLRLAQHDPNERVRASAVGAGALGRFVLLGEYGELPDDEFVKVQDAVIAILKDPAVDVDIRRRALESIANSSHEIVPQEIRKAYNSGDHRMRVSAIFAMGRSSDPLWEDIVLNELDNNDAEIRFEATRASGEIGILEAVPKLGHLLVEDDREIQMSAIWALGEIGGREAERILDAMRDVAEEAEDEDMIDAIDDSLANTRFSDKGMFGIYEDLD